MKDVELRLIAELMKNSRRSDRELAKAVGISQPTVSRTLKKLEKEGYIREYTIIPNFSKLGFTILAITFVKLESALDPQQIDKARKIAKESLEPGPFEIVMLERGIGLGFEGVVISYHEDYSTYTKFLQWLRQFDFLKVDRIQSFLVNLNDEIRYRPWTYTAIANYVSHMKQKKE